MLDIIMPVDGTADYYTTPDLACNIFRHGFYSCEQWVRQAI